VSVTGYTWNFDDDNREDYPALSDPTTHTYSSSNDYDVTFGASSADGCFASVTHQISVGDIPDVNLRWSSVCDGDPTRFALSLHTSATILLIYKTFFGNSAMAAARLKQTPRSPTPSDSIP